MKLAVVPLVLPLLLVELATSLPFYFRLGTSLALGMMLTAVSIILICWVCGVILQELTLGRSLHFLVWPAIAIVWLFAFILAHALVAGAIRPIDLERLGQTLVPLLFLVTGGAALGLQFARSSDREVDLAIRVSFWCFCAMIALRIVGLEPASGAYPKAMFPFTEISHFSLAFGPIVMYRAVRAEPSRKLWWIFFAILVGVVLQSLNLLFYCLLIALVCRRLLLVSLLGLGVVVAGLPLELSYFTGRLDFSADSTNLSALVYLQGWQQILESLDWSHGWGLGFEQLGFRETDSAAGVVIRTLTGGDDLNLRDGSFVLVKLLSEFGVFGAIATAVFCFAATRSARALRRGVSDAAGDFSRCVIVGYVVDLFVRSPGYFTGSTLLLICAISAGLMSRERYLRAGAAPPAELQLHIVS